MRAQPEGYPVRVAGVVTFVLTVIDREAPGRRDIKQGLDYSGGGEDVTVNFGFFQTYPSLDHEHDRSCRHSQTRRADHP